MQFQKNKAMLTGEYTHYSTCRFCFYSPLEIVINLGYMPLAGGFFKKTATQKDFNQEKFYPLELAFCPKCYLLQSINVIHRDILFKDYFYFSSAIKTLTDYFQKSAKELNSIYPDPSNRFVVEIGCNDGKLLKELQSLGFKTLGIDPATNVVNSTKGVTIINDFFSESLSKDIVKKYNRADAVLSFNTLAHIENMHDIIKGIKHLLKRGGILIFGVHYLGNLIKETQYDMIYHEHQYYYSLLTLENFFNTYSMQIYDVRKISMHAGSIMFFVQDKKYGKKKVSTYVRELKKEERMLGLHKKETYKNFMASILKKRGELLKTIKKIKSTDNNIAGYGASGRGTVIINYCQLTKQVLNFIIDDAPAKQGAFTPGTHFRIKNPKILYGHKKPSYVLLFAWPFFDEIIKKHKKYLQQGGKFILPLPNIKIISKHDIL